MNKFIKKITSIILSFMMILSIMPGLSFADGDELVITMPDDILIQSLIEGSITDGLGSAKDEKSSSVIFEGDSIALTGNIIANKAIVRETKFKFNIYDKDDNLLKTFDDESGARPKDKLPFCFSLSPELAKLEEIKVEIIVNDKEGNYLTKASNAYKLKEVKKEGTTYLKYLTKPNLKNVDAAVENPGPTISGAIAFKDDKTGKVNMYLSGTCGVMKSSDGDTDLEIMNGFKYEYINYNRGMTPYAYDIGGTSEDNMAILYRDEDNNTPPSVYAYNQEKDIWDKVENSQLDSRQYSETSLVMAKDDIYIIGNNYSDKDAYWDGTKWNESSIKFTSFTKTDNNTAFAGSYDGLYKHTYDEKNNNSGNFEKISIPEFDGKQICVLSSTIDSKIYVTTNGYQEGPYAEANKASEIYEVDTTKETPTIKTVYNPSDDVFTLKYNYGGIKLGADFNGNIYGIGSKTLYSNGTYGYTGGQLFKQVDGLFQRQRVPGMGGTNSDGEVINPDGIHKIINPIDKLTLFVGYNGAIYSIDETGTEVDTSLQEAKDKAKSDLNKELAVYKESDYTAENWTALNKVKTDADTEIDKATSVADVNAIFDKAVKDMAAIPKNDKKEDIDVYVTMEKFTLGQGFKIEPIKVTVPERTKASKVITDLLGEGNYKMTGTVDSNFYLSYIKDNNTEIKIPQYILSAINNKVEDRGDDEWLGEFDYYNMSGWMYAVNGKFPGVGAAGYKLEDNDVMRWQYTLYGYGADLGGAGDWGTANIVNPADKDNLVRAIADLNASENKDQMISSDENKKAYDEAYETMENMESTQEEVDKITKELKGMELPPDDAQAKKVIKLIDAIGEVTLDKKYQVKEARKAYNELPKEQKQYVTNIDVLVEAEKTIAKIEAVNQAFADKAINAINAIDLSNGYSVENKANVLTAKSLYEELTDEQKALVDKDLVTKLNNFVKKIKDLEVENFLNLVNKIVRPAKEEDLEKVAEATIAYGNMSKELKEKDSVKEAKAELNEITLEIGADKVNKETANALIAEFKAMKLPLSKDDLQKGKLLVNSYERLNSQAKKYFDKEVDALNAYETIVKHIKLIEKANEVDALISAIPKNITKDDYDYIKEVRAKYDALSKDEQAYVENLEKLTKAESAMKDSQEADKLADKFKAIELPLSRKDLDKAKELVSKYESLDEKVKVYFDRDYAALKACKEITKDIKLIKTANEIDNLISDIPENITKDDFDYIKEVKSKYDKLTDDEKSYVQYAKKLEEALSKITIDFETKLTVHTVKDDATSVTGKGQAGAKIDIYSGEELLATGAVKEDGTFEITIPSQKKGTELVVKMTQDGYNDAQVKLNVEESLKDDQDDGDTDNGDQNKPGDADDTENPDDANDTDEPNQGNQQGGNENNQGGKPNKSSGANGSGNSPQTGDASIVIYAGLAFISMAGLGVIKRKRK
ncbi:Ig-like domain-containing protein [Terrisporobacter glycolicus]|uniref:Ig-like domain-containing protein n=1 Tax=Terrisporobacter petrolearius TaxID=1460447 RepID=UPI0011DE0869